jgi:hypothetical protein
LGVAQQQSEPQLLITWRARSYAPPAFTGKVLPTLGSLVTASVEVVEGGKLADLSKQTIYWYLDDDFLDGGPGVQRVSFRVTSIRGGKNDLRAELPVYRGRSTVLKTVEIPVVWPEAVVEAPFPNGTFSGDSIQLVGAPYFFNALDGSKLNLRWNVNGVEPANVSSPFALSVAIPKETPSGYAASVMLTVSRTGGSERETADGFAQLVFSK